MLLVALAVAAALGLLIGGRDGALDQWRAQLQDQFAALGGRLGGATSAPPAADAVELARLRADLGRAQDALVRAQALEQENARLREQLGIAQLSGWRMVGAEVGARTPDVGRRTLLIGVGSDQGVVPGMAVVARASGGPAALIGVVSRVSRASATVVLLADYTSAMSVRIYHQDTTLRGVISGGWQRTDRLRLDGFGRGEVPRAGDIVVTDGLTARLRLDLPQGAVLPDIPLGTVEAVRDEGRATVADIVPYIDPDQVSYAWIILGSESK